MKKIFTVKTDESDVIKRNLWCYELNHDERMVLGHKFIVSNAEFETNNSDNTTTSKEVLESLLQFEKDCRLEANQDCFMGDTIVEVLLHVRYVEMNNIICDFCAADMGCLNLTIYGEDLDEAIKNWHGQGVY